MAVILVHRRPVNVDLQVRAALLAPSIGEVVVSCNNPEVRLDDWLTVSSPRLRTRLDYGRNQTRRYAVALESGADRFVLPDDDVLFSPEAIDEFCRALGDGAAMPIGMAGQRLGPSGLWESGITAAGEEVDVLNRAYACTRAHAEGVFENAALLGWDEEATFSNPADDVLVSFAGIGCPTIAPLRHVNCVSHDDGRLSTFLQPGFHDARAEWVATLRATRGRSAASRAPGARDIAPAVPPVAERALRVATLPLRARFYTGRNVRSLALVPRSLRRRAGLDDDGAMVTQRVQIGTGPVPLDGYVRVGDSDLAHLTMRAPAWAPNPHRLFATEVVAFGVLDRIDPALVPMALASWRAMLAKGGRLLVGVTDSSAILSPRDGALRAASWGSQRANGTAVLTSPLQLTDDRLTTTLWDADRLAAAVRGQGFEVVATATSGDDIELVPGVSPWPVVTSRGARPLLPVPAALNGAADIVVVARAR